MRRGDLFLRNRVVREIGTEDKNWDNVVVYYKLFNYLFSIVNKLKI